MKYGFLLLLPLLASCDRTVEVSHPFYLTSIEDSAEIGLFRCPDSPGRGCASDGLPGPKIIAAGADKAFVVVAQERDGRTAYYYFARVPEETSGWGNNPEKIVGPLDQAAFDSAKKRLGLPPLTVRP